MQKVLVTDCDSRKALCVIRSLGDQGYNVIAACDKKINMSRFSKYCSHFVSLPNPKSEEENFVRELSKELEKNSIDTVVPMEDETVELLIRNQGLLGSTKTLLPHIKTFMVARDKAQTMHIAKKNDVSIPKTYFINNIDELEEVVIDINYPVIIKPRISSGSRGIGIINNEDELIKRYKEIHEEYPFPIIQQYIYGSFDKIQVLVMLDQNSNVKASCTYQGIREFPVDGGPVTLWKTISYPIIEEKTINLMQKINWCGFAEIEYIVNQQTGEYFLMEINPRFSANIALGVQLGIDFPLYFVKLASGQDIDYIKNKKFNEYCQWLLPGDILNFVFNKDRFKQEIGYIFKKPKNMHYAILSRQDFKPVVATLLSMFLNIGSNIKNLMSKLKTSKGL